MVGSCLYTLKSKCTGYIFYDGTTEEVSVVNPPFVKSIPQETNYGFIAKVVPTLTTICRDDDDECRQEIRQELAAQVMGEANCGEIVLANAPLCGELPATESADAAKQARFDYMKSEEQEDAGCPQEIRFLAYYMGKRGTGQQAVDCKKWVSMRTLKMRKSQFGFIEKGNSLEGTALQIVAVPVSGGSESDPCYELRIQEGRAGGIPSGGANCDSLIWREHGTENEGWKAENLGARTHLLTTAQVLALGANVNLSNYDVYNAKKCSRIWAIVKGSIFVSLTGSGAGGSGVLLCNSQAIAAGYTPSSGGFWLHFNEVPVLLSSNALTFAISYSVSGTPVPQNQGIVLMGYRID